MNIAVSSREMEDLLAAIDCRLRMLQQDLKDLSVTDHDSMRQALRDDLERLEVLRNHLRSDTAVSRH